VSQRTRKSTLLPIALFILALLLCWPLLRVEYLIGERIALRHVAARLGTTPDRGSIEAHVTDLLRSNLGLKRTEIHELLSTVGEFHYSKLQPTQGGTSEGAYWDMVPSGWPFQGVWALWYDADDRLYQVEIDGL
jgi:hypothetical protein